MNKSRAIVARTARALAEIGLAVVIPDLKGTGDSDGDFIDAHWEDWLADQQHVTEWIREQGASHLVFWGLRCGCLLAAETASTVSAPPDQLVFWQPVHSGKQLMTQFLRLRMMSALGSERGDRREGEETERRPNVAEIRYTLLKKRSLRVAGYPLGAELFQAIESRQMSDFILPRNVLLTVLEITGNSGLGGNRVTQRQLEQWQQSGLQCAFLQVPGDPFWSTQELGLAPALTKDTVAVMGAGHRPSDDERFELTGLVSMSASKMTSLAFSCDESQLVGMIHHPSTETCDTAVVIVTGGPQYRIGSHRQFVLMARELAASGYVVLRFDYRGMGDAEGQYRGFRDIDEDIRSAIDSLQASLPSVKQVVLWGLCDAATASMRYAPSDGRVTALVLANPWVYSEKGMAKTYLKHYYFRRLLTRAFWSNFLSGRFRPARSLSSLAGFIKQALGRGSWQNGGPGAVGGQTSPAPDNASPHEDLAAAFARELSNFPGSVLLLVSGSDLTAAEFVDAAQSRPLLRRALDNPLVHEVRLNGVDHTFSRPEWRQKVVENTVDFLRNL